jgi:hypothetical protein
LLSSFFAIEAAFAVLLARRRHLCFQKLGKTMMMVQRFERRIGPQVIEVRVSQADCLLELLECSFGVSVH